MCQLRVTFGTVVVLVLLGTACSQFPRQPARTDDTRTRGWKVRSSGRCDYVQYLNKDGRVTALEFDDPKTGRPQGCVDLTKVCTEASCPHYVLLLDGVPYDLIKKMYDEGHFRLFYPPSELVSVFPANTDTAYTEMLTPECLMGYEAQFYDRATGKSSRGNDVYLKGENEPWKDVVNYRISILMDPIGYVSPNLIFNQEMGAFEKKMDGCREGTLRLYSVGTTMVETKQGEPGIRKCLERVENLCEKIMYERRGRCRISLLADHGHNLTRAKFFDASSVLKKDGYHVTDKLQCPGDVIPVQFGLVTYVALYTDDPAKVATDLLRQEAVDMAMYPQTNRGTDRVIVRTPDAEAVVEKVGERYRYQAVRGDPLKLNGTIQQLKRKGKVDSQGLIDDRALFEATAGEEFPDAPARLWRAFHGLVKYPADLVVTLRDGWFSGNPSFARTVKVESTHGSLNRINTVTFVMSTIRPLPKAVRTGELVKVFPEMDCPEAEQAKIEQCQTKQDREK